MLARQLVRYLVVGGLGTAVHLALLAFCVEALRLDPVFGAVIGFVGALLVSYGLNRHWTFRLHGTGRPWRYAVVSLGGLMLNTALMYTLVKRFGWPYLPAQLSVVLIVPLSNFLLNRYWAFAPEPR